MRTLPVIALGLASILAATSAAEARSFVPVAGPEQEVIWDSGVPFAISHRGDTTVVFAPDGVDRSKAWIAITVTNRGHSPITVYDNALTAFSFDGRPLKVWGFAALEKREKRKRFWENVGVGLVAAANGYAAGQAGQTHTTSHHSGSVRVSGSGGYASGYYSGTSYSTTYDSAAAARAQAAAVESTQAFADRIRSDQAARSAALGAEAFRTQTIPPGSSHSGRLQIEIPRANRQSGTPVVLRVTVEQQTHDLVAFLDHSPTQQQLLALSARYPSRAQSSHQQQPVVRVPAGPIQSPPREVADSEQVVSAGPTPEKSQPATADVWVMPMVENVEFIEESEGPAVRLTVLLNTSEHGPAAGRLYLQTRDGVSKLAIPSDFTAEQMARRRFSQIITIPLDVIPAEALTWLRSVPPASVQASFR